MIRIIVLLALCAATAIAAPPARVLVADRDPELVRAIDKALAPWRITVIADPKVPDEAHALARADAVNAQFIVWRERDQLVVFDREHGTSERRAASAGAFDPLSAAAAALTVKTMLRLPPLPPETPGETGGNGVVTGPVGPVVPVASTGPELRLQVGVGARVARGSQTDVGGRALLAVLVRPTAALGLRLGIAGDLGTSSDVSRAGFKGSFGDWAVLGIASWTWSVGRFELGPTLGAGVSRSHLDGEMGNTARAESATLPVFRVGATVRWPLGAWSLGASLDAARIVGTPTYIKEVGMGMGNPTTVFEVPAFAAVLGVFAAADLGH